MKPLDILSEPEKDRIRITAIKAMQVNYPRINAGACVRHEAQDAMRE